MNIQCPNCHSARITTRNRARKTAGLIGTVGGCVGGATGSLSGIEIGMTVGVVAGPPGMVFGGVLGALSALWSAARPVACPVPDWANSSTVASSITTAALPAATALVSLHPSRPPTDRLVSSLPSAKDGIAVLVSLSH